MKLKLRYDYQTICDNLLAQKFGELGLSYEVDSQGEVHILQSVSQRDKENIVKTLNGSGIEIIDSQNMVLVQQIKDIISDFVKSNTYVEDFKLSEYIQKKLPYSYSYLSRVFSENTHFSIEKFLILKRIDYVKELLLENKLTLSEIAYKLNYSSVSHLSKQFKKTTGLSPTYFLNLKNQLKTD